MNVPPSHMLEPELRELWAAACQLLKENSDLAIPHGGCAANRKDRRAPVAARTAPTLPNSSPTRSVAKGDSMKSQHPWMCIRAAVDAGDEEKAKELLQNADARLTRRRRVSAAQMIKRSFAPDPPEFKSAATRRAEQDESANNSPVVAALARRKESRQKRAAALNKNTKKSIGWRFPPETGVEYSTPDPGGFNLPK
jgi:hypothetical protein